MGEIIDFKHLQLKSFSPSLSVLDVRQPRLAVLHNDDYSCNKLPRPEHAAAKPPSATPAPTSTTFSKTLKLSNGLFSTRQSSTIQEEQNVIHVMKQFTDVKLDSSSKLY